MTTDMSEKEKMLAGALYDPFDPELKEMRRRARRWAQAFNRSDADDAAGRRRLLDDLLESVGRRVWIEPPVYVDYGCFITLGDNVYINTNCVILDCNRVRIGNQTQLGPNVTLSPATHPVNAAERVAGPEMAYPITIGNRVWIGAGAIIGPGVTIGDDTTIGAGSVVMKDVPPRVVAAGNPAHVIRTLAD